MRDCGVISLPKSVISEMNMWWNSAYRDIFGYNKWESVKELICMLNRLDVHHLINLRQLLFIKRTLACNNSIVSGVAH